MTTLKEIKQRFFLFRNGMLADTLRNYGVPHKVIFGLEVPRLAEIASEITLTGQERNRLAEELWADREVRESRLLAAYLFREEETESGRILALALENRTQEEADMISFRLLKRLSDPRAMLRLIEAEAEAGSEAAARSARVLRQQLDA